MKNDLLDRINYFGIEKQRRKFGEEADELKEAIIIHEIKKSVEYDIPLSEIIGTKEHIAEEIADNLALLRQFQLYYEITDEEIIDIFKEKNERTKERTKKGYYEKKTMNKLKILELFGGIGACSKALERLGIDYEIADYVEIDKYAVKSFNAIHGTNFEPQDICTWDKDIEADLIMHGSPCQDFSLAGKQAGGDKDSGTRSSLMYETIRIVEKLKPKYVIWENVKNLLSKKHIHNFNAYLETMEKLGYTNYYQVLNAKDYGVPQSRERIFIISIRNDINLDFKFPQKEILNKTWKDFVGDCSKEYIKVNKTPSRDKMRIKCKNITNECCCNTITLKQDRYPNAGIINFENYYRFLTPREQWLLMGFDDEDFEKASKVNSNVQLCKQAGNSIVVNVLEAILKELI